MTVADSRPAILLVCSHGGHLTEILDLLPSFDDYEPFYFCYDADTTRALPRAALVPNRPYSPFQFILNLGRCWNIVSQYRPAAVVSTGAEIAIAPFIVAKLRRIPTIYIECGAQATRPSVTGRILARIADTFYVQWPELLDYYGERARYAGSLIDETFPEPR